MNKLRADLLRFRQLIDGDNVMPLSSFRLWLTCLHPRVMPVALVRLAEILNRNGWGRLAKLVAMINVVIFGLEVSPKVSIGGGLFLPHTVGTVVGADRIGENCTILQGVTLGAAEMDLVYTRSTRPIIGNNVFIGAGAKVIGRVSVGDYAKIGANAVVVKDVPNHAVATGIPATFILPSDSPAVRSE